ncbi:MAG: hypothetical protein F6K48_06860 [Okeania sp. SIO3H1]|nr:hypothetical protein [Okeania sp. SIO3H1]
MTPGVVIKRANIDEISSPFIVSLESWEIGVGMFSGKRFSMAFDVAFSLILSKRLW